jgi:hypothetical protein
MPPFVVRRPRSFGCVRLRRKETAMILWLIHLKAWRALHEAAAHSALQFLDYEEEKLKER